MTPTGPLVSVHAFGLGSVSGGAKILRTLFHQAPMVVQVINTELYEGKPTENELRIRPRPYFGRVEHTRFNTYFAHLEKPLEPCFFARVQNALRRLRPALIHSVVQDLSFWPAFEYSREHGIPFALSVHDDLGYIYSVLKRPGRTRALELLKRVWNEAEVCFVISDEMGQEYCSRYGERAYTVTTDAYTRYLPLKSGSAERNQLRLYFMGLFHIGYAANLNCLLQAVELLKQRSALQIDLRFRCGSLPPSVKAAKGGPLRVLPLVTEGVDLIGECSESDLLYLPLPFQEEFADFVRLSLSTKLVSYVASGTPILFHGPEVSAAGALLAKHKAAIQVNSLDPAVMASKLELFARGVSEICDSAREPLQQRFIDSQVRKQFWDALARTCQR